jgi:hypothetical protein
LVFELGVQGADNLDNVTLPPVIDSRLSSLEKFDPALPKEPLIDSVEPRLN